MPPLQNRVHYVRREKGEAGHPLQLAITQRCFITGK